MAVIAVSNNVTNDLKLRNDLERTPVPQADFLSTKNSF